MDGYNVKGLSSRHRLILMHDIDTATGRQPLLHIVIGKCLEPVHEITVALANVQQQTNELTKLANMVRTRLCPLSCVRISRADQRRGLVRRASPR